MAEPDTRVQFGADARSVEYALLEVISMKNPHLALLGETEMRWSGVLEML